MTRVRRGQVEADCADEQRDRDKLPIVTADNAYGGRGAKLTAIVVDGDKAWFDEPALHGRTAAEQSVAWAASPDEVPGGRVINPVWVYIRPAQRGSFRYFGLVAASMLIDEASNIGYKSLGEHVNRMGHALNGKVDLELLDNGGRAALLRALQQYPEVLANSSDELKQAVGAGL